MTLAGPPKKGRAGAPGSALHHDNQADKPAEVAEPP
jgi:hypothetical protein